MDAGAVSLLKPSAAWEVDVRPVDDAGFSAFYVAQWSDVLGYVYSLCSDRYLAEELTQEAMSRLYSRWPVREARPYCFRIATNLARDHSAASRRTAPAELTPVARDIGIDPDLLDAVRRLPPRQTEVVLLHYYADLPLRDIALTLRRPLGTVKRQLHEARASLALVLGGHT